ncbi:hypothetical protein Btru_012261 [Bulinus truncatus]|nr:hypothetical protein Btru_012261 [Bulinus truncatus]
MIAKTSHNRFTRVRRIITGLTMLQTLMIVNLMFFGIRDFDDSRQFIQILDYKLHLISIIIGIETSIIITIVGLSVTFLFNGVAPRPAKTLEDELTEEEKELVRTNIARHLFNVTHPVNVELNNKSDLSVVTEILSSEEQQTSFLNMFRVNNNEAQSPKNISQNFFAEGEFQQESESIANIFLAETEHRNENRTAKNCFLLPWWFIYITWMTLALFNVFLAYYIMLYGLSLGYEKSVDWTIAFFTGFLTDILIFQPVKVVLIAFILILILKQRYTLRDQAPVAKHRTVGNYGVLCTKGQWATTECCVQRDSGQLRTAVYKGTVGNYYCSVEWAGTVGNYGLLCPQGQWATKDCCVHRDSGQVRTAVYTGTVDNYGLLCPQGQWATTDCCLHRDSGQLRTSVYTGIVGNYGLLYTMDRESGQLRTAVYTGTVDNYGLLCPQGQWATTDCCVHRDSGQLRTSVYTGIVGNYGLLCTQGQWATTDCCVHRDSWQRRTAVYNEQGQRETTIAVYNGKGNWVTMDCCVQRASGQLRTAVYTGTVGNFMDCCVQWTGRVGNYGLLCTQGQWAPTYCCVQ